jgi:tRNA A37 threonylcarbamoyladenosine modification protein TsaB
VVRVSSLDILAANAPETPFYVTAAVDAKRKLVYSSSFKFDGGRLKRKTPYRLLSVEDFIKTAKPKSLVLGDAIGLYRDEFSTKISGVKLLDKDYWSLKPHNLIRLAQEKIKNGEAESPFSVNPLYLYPKECQIKNALL